MSSGNKFARGTGRGQFGTPQSRGPVVLRNGPGSSKKTSVGQGRETAGYLGAGNGGTATNAREESFQLHADPTTADCPFAMFIRLQPETLEELKQAEADGIQALMKFGTNASGHVIKVGSESFKFSSASEPGDLCDIYEQKQGDFGEAVLVEAGSAWRKLSVQRILSATEKDRVKKRTAEAEHRQKQRKSILVDPSTQMIIPQAGVADANGRKPVPKLSKEPPPKKRRVTSSPIKQKTQTITAAVTGSRQFTSPASPSVEPLATGVKSNQANQTNYSIPFKGQAGSDRVTGPSSSVVKEKAVISAPTSVPESVKSGLATNLTDLRNFLIGFMQDNPKGVTNKAIEKAVAESLSGVADKRALEKVMKSIASFHAPGKYLLNAGIEKGNYLEPGPPAGSGRAQEVVRPAINEPELLNGIVVKEGIKDMTEKDEPLSFRRVPAVVKEESPKDSGAQPLESKINYEDSNKQEAAHGSKVTGIRASDSSSSSGSGSGSDSESDSSGSVSRTESGSGSGSESDSGSSSSSSGASMDEDVEIMSDDDAENGKLEAKQKPKVREPKPLTKEENKTHDVELYEEADHNLSQHNPLEILDAPNDGRSDTLEKMSDNIIEAVFGADETDANEIDFGERIKDRAEVKERQLKNVEKNVPAKAQTSKVSSDSNFGECHHLIPNQDNEALGKAEDLSISVEKPFEANKEVWSEGGSLGGILACQQEHSKLLPKFQGPSKDGDKRRADPDYINGSNLDGRDRGIYSSSEGRSASKNHTSSEAHGLPLKVLASEKEERPAKVPSEKPSQTGSEVRKAVSKKSSTRETHEKYEKSKAPDALVKGRSPGNVAWGTERSANALEGILKPDDKKSGRLCDRGDADTSDVLGAKLNKDKAMEERTLDGTKIGDISSKQSRDFEMQHLQQKDVVVPSKGNVHRISKEQNYVSVSHDKDSPHAHKSNKAVKHSRQKADVFDRAGLVVEQAERPLEDWDSTRRGKEAYGKGTSKEAESVGRHQGGEPSKVAAWEAARFGESGQSYGRNNVRENCKELPQLLESRDPPFGNGSLEPKKWLPSLEDFKGKAFSGTTSRMVYKGSSSPDEDDFQPLDRRLLDMARQSPVRSFEELRNRPYDARSTKRKPEETEGMVVERSKRKAGTGQVKHPPHKDECFQGGLFQQSHTEKGRFSTSDSQDNAGTSNFSAFENSVRSEEEPDELYRQQKPTKAASSDLHKEKAVDFLDTFKRQSPQSAEEVDGFEFFAPYEKKKPDLRGLINTFQEYKDCCKEYHEKYAIYVKLNDFIEHHKKPFESLRRDMDRARSKEDGKKLANVRAKVRREYALRRKKRKRMFHTFRVLHEELKVIKNRCKEYAEKVGQG